MATDEWVKDPSDVLDFSFDWSLWLADGEIITDSTITATAGLDIDSETNTNTTATAWVSGGTSSKVYKLTNRIVTNQNRTKELSYNIRVTSQ